MKFIIRIFYASLIFLSISCSTKKQATDEPGDLTDIKDFPKEWVLVDDIASPDSISRNYVIPMDSSNSFIGGITIKQNGTDWLMINSGFFYPGTYQIKNCKRISESEMVYYYFDLQSTESPTQLKFEVNFRHNPGQSDDVPSVFTCTTCDNRSDVLMAEKTVVDSYPKKPLSTLQYD